MAKLDTSAKGKDETSSLSGLQFNGSRLLVAVSTGSATDAGDRYDSAVRVWSVSDFRERASIAADPTDLLDLAVSPDGRTLATAGDGHGIRLWNPGTGKLVATLNGHEAETNDLAFSPDGRCWQAPADHVSLGAGEAVRRGTGHQGLLRCSIGWRCHTTVCYTMRTDR